LVTSFELPFEQFLLIIDDPKFINNYTEDNLAIELSKYIYRSIGICRNYLIPRVDINNYTKTSSDGITIGNFTDDLNDQEITYIARGMTVPYLEFQLQKQKHLNQLVYGKDYQVHSQANHMKEVRETIKNVREELIQDMVMNSYQQDSDELKGSSGANSL